MGRMKKGKYRNCFEERSVELLKHFYEFDEERKTFDIVLHYEKASELFDGRFDLMKNRTMKGGLVDQIASMLEDIPHGYKADISIVVDDYENIPYQEILDSFHNALEIRFARFKGGSMKKHHKVGILVLIGAFLVALMITGEFMGWWGGDTTRGRLTSYLIDTAGCVLIWEGLYSALLDRTKDATLGYMLSERLASIGLYRNDGTDDALASEAQCDVILFNREKRGKRIGTVFLYVSGFFLVGAGLIGVMLRIPTFAELIKASWGVALIFSILDLLSSVFLCGLGFLAIRIYNEDYRLYVLTAIMTGLVGALAALSLTNFVMGITNPATIVASVVSLTIMVFYVIGFILFSHYHWDDIKRTLRRKK